MALVPQERTIFYTERPLRTKYEYIYARSTFGKTTPIFLEGRYLLLESFQSIFIKISRDKLKHLVAVSTRVERHKL